MRQKPVLHTFGIGIFVIFLYATFATTCLQSFAGESPVIDWLAKSRATGVQVTEKSVPVQFQAVQLLLSQAMGYAALGDIENVAALLAFEKDPRPAWSSGGEGMGRKVVVGIEISVIHKIMLSALVAGGRYEDAYQYCQGLAGSPYAEEMWFYLGMQLPDTITIPDQQQLKASSAPFAALQVGVVTSLAGNSQYKEAKEIYGRIDSQARGELVGQAVMSLAVDKEWSMIQSLLTVSSSQGEPAPEPLVFVMGLLSRAGELDVMASLVQTMKGPAVEEMQNGMAMAYLSAKRLDDAEAFFDISEKTNLRRWEPVAFSLQKVDWLLAYYDKLTNPWRKTERQYQLAKRMLQDGKEAESLLIAQTAGRSAALIERVSERSLAYQLLAEYYSLRGDLPNTQAMAMLVDESQTRQSQLAAAQVARAHMKSGDPAAAVQTAWSIGDVKIQIKALVLSAAAAQNDGDYQQVIQVFRETCTKITDDRLRQQAWKELVELEVQRQDYAGAVVSVQLAVQSGAGAAAAEILVRDYTEKQQFDKAFTAIQWIPVGMDPSVGSDRHQRALEEVITALADQGNGRRAMQELQKIENQYVRDRTVQVVARALVKAGDVDSAVALVTGIQSSSARGEALSVLLFELVKAGRLPPARLLSQMPDRKGGRICWAVAAAASEDVSTIETWLSDIQPKSCRAFAYAGAAFSLVSPPPWRNNPTAILEFVDPSKMPERMAYAMQRQALAKSGKKGLH